MHEPAATLNLPAVQYTCIQLCWADCSRTLKIRRNLPPRCRPTSSKKGKIRRSQWSTGSGHLQRICLAAELLVCAAGCQAQRWKRTARSATAMKSVSGILYWFCILNFCLFVCYGLKRLKPLSIYWCTYGGDRGGFYKVITGQETNK